MSRDLWHHGAVRSRAFPCIGAVLACALGLSGCFLDAEGVRPSTGGSSSDGGGGAGAGAGAQGGGGDGGGVVGCGGPEDCPDPLECREARCDNGACSESFLAEGTTCGEGTNQACDGAGTCLGLAGHPCGAEGDCLGLACVDAFCCDADCDTECASCDQAGLEGTCTPHAAATDPEGCAPGTCDGAGECASGVGLGAGAVGTGSGDTYLVDLAVAPSGAATMFGYFTSTTNAGGGDLTSAGAHDLVVAQLDAAGAHVWSKRFGDSADQFARALAVGPSGELVLAGNLFGTVDFGGGALPSTGSRDAFLVKLDAAGNHQWSERFGDGNEQSLDAVAVAANGDVITAGDFGGSIDLGGGALTSAGSLDIVVARFNAAGTHLWSKRFGEGNEQRVTGIAVDAAGNVWLTGYYVGAVDFGGGPLAWLGSYDVFLVKLDPAGNHLFSARFGDGSDQRARAVAVGPDGEVALAGGFQGVIDLGNGSLTSQGSYDAFVAAFDGAGAPAWSKSFGNSSEQQAWGLTIDPSGSVIVAGEMQGSADFGGGSLSSQGGYDVFAAKFASDGSHLWSRRDGDSNTQYSNEVASAPDGSLWLAGYFLGVLDFGTGGQLTNVGGHDGYWAHLLP